MLFSCSKYHFISIHILLLIQASESNCHIFVEEEGLWSIKGKYSVAVKDDDSISWVMGDDGKLQLTLLAVS